MSGKAVYFSVQREQPHAIPQQRYCSSLGIQPFFSKFRKLLIGNNLTYEIKHHFLLNTCYFLFFLLLMADLFSSAL